MASNNVSNLRPHHALRDQGNPFYGESVRLRPSKMARYHGIVGGLKYSTFPGRTHLYHDIQNVFLKRRAKAIAVIWLSRPSANASRVHHHTI